MIRVLNLGAGVQSSTLLLMANAGEIAGGVDHAIFADTGHEPAPVYAWLEYLVKQSEIPIHVVRDARGLEAGVMEGWAAIPVFTPQGQAMSRSCTDKLKIRPIERKVRELAGLGPRSNPHDVLVEQLFGISLDEIQRMKPNRHRWIRNEWPLVDKRMSRHDCQLWLQRHGHPEAPKSACYFCPYRNKAGWRWLRDHAPADFERAVDFEARLQARSAAGERVNGGLRAKPYLHASLKPLPMVDLSTAADAGQLQLLEADECSGTCFV